MKKIALISTYFGKYPDYFNLWLKSAAKNNSIDFFMYGDCDVTKYEIPDNVYIKFISFEELKEKIQSLFDFEIVLDRPYKLCDYRPAFGCVFEQELYGYDYWGHFDLDMIFGDLRDYLPDDDYDKIYSHGHLTLYKNNVQNNRRFMCDGGLNYKDVFTTDYSCIFDETRGIDKKFRILGITIFDAKCYADIARRRKNFTLNSNICRKNYKFQIFYYDNGRIFRDYIDNKKLNTDEFNYIHISHRKIVDKTNNSDSFYITHYGFIEKKGDTTLETIIKYNAPTPYENIFYSFNTQVIRRLIRMKNYLVSKLRRRNG